MSYTNAKHWKLLADLLILAHEAMEKDVTPDHKDRESESPTGKLYPKLRAHCDYEDAAIVLQVQFERLSSFKQSDLQMASLQCLLRDSPWLRSGTNPSELSFRY